MASGSQRTFRTVRASHRLALLFAPRLTVPAGGTSMAERPMKQAAAEWEACRDAAAGCTRCHLYQNATQTVFGEGAVDARMLFVGEQPGDREDLAGKTLIGPAGQIFDRALGEAGIDREKVYVTHAVKHFKFEQRGKRRLPSQTDVGRSDEHMFDIQ